MVWPGTSMQSDKHLCCSKKGISFEQKNIPILKHEIWENSYALTRLGKFCLEELKKYHINNHDSVLDYLNLWAFFFFFLY